MTTPYDAPEVEQIVAVSPDGNSVLIAADQFVSAPTGGRGKNPSATVTYRVRDVGSGNLLWELPTTDTGNSMGVFSDDGRRIGVTIGSSFQVWDFGENQQIYDSPLNLNTMAPPILFPDGRRVYGRYGILDLRTGAKLSHLEFGSHYAAIVNDSFIVAEYDGQLRYWRRRRVEGAWSPLNFPEAWVTCGLAIACVVNVVRHSRRKRKRN